MIVGERVVPPTDSAYGASKDQFGYEYKENGKVKLVWYACRELFHGNVNSFLLRNFWFSHVNDLTDVAVFMNKLEDHFDLAVRSYFYKGKSYFPTINYGHVVLSPWWLEDIMRYNLSTVMLRAAGKMEKGADWKSIVYSQKYAAGVPGFDLFMKGYTTYTGTDLNWYSAFFHLITAEASKFLTKPVLEEKDRKEELKRIAYEKWKEDGEPENSHDVYWEYAIKKHFGIFYSSVK